MTKGGVQAEMVDDLPKNFPKNGKNEPCLGKSTSGKRYGLDVCRLGGETARYETELRSRMRPWRAQGD